MARDRPAVGSSVVEPADLAGDRWVIGPTVDGEWDGLRRVFAAAGLDPPVLRGDYDTAASLIVMGEAVAPCRPTSGPRDDMRPCAARRPARRPAAARVAAAYHDAAMRAPGYRQWLLRKESPLSVGSAVA